MPSPARAADVFDQLFAFQCFRCQRGACSPSNAAAALSTREQLRRHFLCAFGVACPSTIGSSLVSGRPTRPAASFPLRNRCVPTAAALLRHRRLRGEAPSFALLSLLAPSGACPYLTLACTACASQGGLSNASSGDSAPPQPQSGASSSTHAHARHACGFSRKPFRNKSWWIPPKSHARRYCFVCTK